MSQSPSSLRRSIDSPKESSSSKKRSKVGIQVQLGGNDSDTTDEDYEDDDISDDESGGNNHENDDSVVKVMVDGTAVYDFTQPEVCDLSQAEMQANTQAETQAETRAEDEGDENNEPYYSAQSSSSSKESKKSQYDNAEEAANKNTPSSSRKMCQFQNLKSPVEAVEQEQEPKPKEVRFSQLDDAAFNLAPLSEKETLPLPTQQQQQQQHLSLPQPLPPPQSPTPTKITKPKPPSSRKRRTSNTFEIPWTEPENQHLTRLFRLHLCNFTLIASELQPLTSNIRDADSCKTRCWDLGYLEAAFFRSSSVSITTTNRPVRSSGKTKINELWTKDEDARLVSMYTHEDVNNRDFRKISKFVGRGYDACSLRAGVLGLTDGGSLKRKSRDEGGKDADADGTIKKGSLSEKKRRSTGVVYRQIPSDNDEEGDDDEDGSYNFRYEADTSIQKTSSKMKKTDTTTTRTRAPPVDPSRDDETESDSDFTYRRSYQKTSTSTMKKRKVIDDDDDDDDDDDNDKLEKDENNEHHVDTNKTGVEVKVADEGEGDGDDNIYASYSSDTDTNSQNSQSSSCIPVPKPPPANHRIDLGGGGDDDCDDGGDGGSMNVESDQTAQSDENDIQTRSDKKVERKSSSLTSSSSFSSSSTTTSPPLHPTTSRAAATATTTISHPLHPPKPRQLMTTLPTNQRFGKTVSLSSIAFSTPNPNDVYGYGSIEVEVKGGGHVLNSKNKFVCVRFRPGGRVMVDVGELYVVDVEEEGF